MKDTGLIKLACALSVLTMMFVLVVGSIEYSHSGIQVHDTRYNGAEYNVGKLPYFYDKAGIHYEAL